MAALPVDDLARLAGGAPIVLFRADAAGRMLWVNAAWARMSGRPVEAALGDGWAQAVDPEDLPRLRAAIAESLATGRRFVAETRVRRPDGTCTLVLIQADPEAADGTVCAWNGAITELTALRCTERALVASEARWRDLLDGVPLGVVITRAGTISYANAAYARLLGWDDPAELVGTSLAAHVDDSERLRVMERARQRESGGPFERRYRALARRRDGAPVPVQVDVVRLDSGDGAASLAFVADLTAQEDAERALRASEAQLQTAFDTIPIHLVVIDGEGRVLRQNPASVAFWGRQQAVPQDLGEVQASWAEDSRRALAGETVEKEVGFVRDGQRVLLHVVVAPIRASGAIVGAIAAAVDLTHQRRLEEQLRQAQKMEAIGQLAGGIAHDFNNLLTAILGFAGMLAERHPAGDPSRPAIDQVLRAAERAAELTAKLLAFARKQVVTPRPLDPARVLGDLAGLLRRVIGEHVALDLVLADGLWRVRADAAQLEQVVMNLVVNARDAMPRGGRVTIAARNRSIAADDQTMSAGDWVALEVRDTGTGIAPEAMAHLFEPFFTTKHGRGGTGLGLSTVYGIVSQAGGRILVRSAPGEGTVFTVLLPRCVEEEDTVTRHLPRLARGGRETVLVVEDEMQVRELVADALRAKGYEVLAAPDARTATELVAPPVGRRIDLLLSDVIMPGMSGTDLAERVLALQPRARVLLMSGYTGDGVDLRAGPARPFIAKPFTPTQLLSRVREVLDGRG